MELINLQFELFYYYFAPTELQVDLITQNIRNSNSSIETALKKLQRSEIAIAP